MRLFHTSARQASSEDEASNPEHHSATDEEQDWPAPKMSLNPSTALLNLYLLRDTVQDCPHNSIADAWEGNSWVVYWKMLETCFI